MNNAIGCAFARDRTEADHRLGCVVYAPGRRWVKESAGKRAKWKSYARVDALAASVDYAFEISGPAGPAHVLLKKIPPRALKPELHLLPKGLLDAYP